MCLLMCLLHPIAIRNFLPCWWMQETRSARATNAGCLYPVMRTGVGRSLGDENIKGHIILVFSLPLPPPPPPNKPDWSCPCCPRQAKEVWQPELARPVSSGSSVFVEQPSFFQISHMMSIFQKISHWNGVSKTTEVGLDLRIISRFKNTWWCRSQAPWSRQDYAPEWQVSGENQEPRPKIDVTCWHFFPRVNLKILLIDSSI